jgi:hypothetical protein
MSGPSEADKAVDLFMHEIRQAILREVMKPLDKGHPPGLLRALTIIKRVWQQ